MGADFDHDSRNDLRRIATRPPGGDVPSTLETVPAPAWKTTLLGIMKNVAYVSAILTASFAIDLDAFGRPMLPDPGSSPLTYVVFFGLVAVRVALSLMESRATADREPTSPPGGPIPNVDRPTPGPR